MKYRHFAFCFFCKSVKLSKLLFLL